jgi:hypothetical protein
MADDVFIRDPALKQFIIELRERREDGRPLLEMIMPNGKQLGDCTRDDIGEILRLIRVGTTDA